MSLRRAGSSPALDTMNICKICSANWEEHQGSVGCPECDVFFELLFSPKNNCNCDINTLMTQGCKCGWFQEEQAKQLPVIIHYWTRGVLCGERSTNVSLNRSDVTCKKCLALLKED